MNYYHNLITEKSWQKLQEIKRKYKFILIGGWAVYLYTKALKSKDIDFICDHKTLQNLKNLYELQKNERLKKYEIHVGEFDIDIYVPFFSDLGLPVEDLEKMSQEMEGFTVLKPEALLILKQNAYRDRAGSSKGEKDKIDIISLLYHAIDLKKYTGLLNQYNLTGNKDELRKILKETRQIPELSLSEHAFSGFRKKILAGL